MGAARRGAIAPPNAEMMRVRVANRSLADQGVIADGFGNLSFRSTPIPIVLQSRARAAGLGTATRAWSRPRRTAARTRPPSSAALHPREIYRAAEGGPWCTATRHGAAVGVTARAEPVRTGGVSPARRAGIRDPRIGRRRDRHAGQDRPARAALPRSSGRTRRAHARHGFNSSHRDQAGGLARHHNDLKPAS